MEIRIASSFGKLLIITLSIGYCGFAQAVSVSVPGTANPYLAGMPDGSIAPPDRAPDQSPVEVIGLNLSGGGVVTFTNATGGVSNVPICDGTNCSSIDGNVYNGVLFYDHEAGSQNGISDIRAPINSLLGVFLTNNPPNLASPSAKLDFQTIGLNFTALSPGLQQVFFIGDGRTSNGVIQQFVIPDHAARLFLGTMDGTQWLNNSGAIRVDVALAIPEPETYAMFMAGLGLMVFMTRRRVKGHAFSRS
jgi:hypothetical protein